MLCSFLVRVPSTRHSYVVIHNHQQQTSKKSITEANEDIQCEWTLSSRTLLRVHSHQANAKVKATSLTHGYCCFPFNYSHQPMSKIKEKITFVFDFAWCEGITTEAAIDYCTSTDEDGLKLEKLKYSTLQKVFHFGF